MHKFTNVLLSGLVLAYPFFVFLSVDKLPLSLLAICLFALFVLRLFLVVRQRQQRSPSLNYFVMASAILGCILTGFAFIFQHERSLLFYPVLMNLLAFLIFSASLVYPPSIIEIFARFMDKQFPAHAIGYTRNVTIAWCLFFIINGSLALFTALSQNMVLWTWYNGLISYLLMGLFFILEFCIRRYVKRKHTHSL